MADINLGNIVSNATVRKIIYSLYVVAGVVLGAIQVGFASVESAGQPSWLTISLAVYAFLSVPLGSLALSNTPSQGAVVEVYEASE